MSGISQHNVFGTNKATVNGGGGGAIIAGGFAGAMCLFAMTVGALVGGALALAILVLGATGAGCMFLGAVVRAGLHIAYWREHRQMPPRAPIIVGHLRQPAPAPELEAPAAAPWGETRVWRPPSSDTDEPL
jgi:hypothetical protein